MNVAKEAILKRINERRRERDREQERHACKHIHAKVPAPMTPVAQTWVSEQLWRSRTVTRASIASSFIRVWVRDLPCDLATAVAWMLARHRLTIRWHIFGPLVDDSTADVGGAPTASNIDIGQEVPMSSGVSHSVAWPDCCSHEALVALCRGHSGLQCLVPLASSKSRAEFISFCWSPHGMIFGLKNIWCQN